MARRHSRFDRVVWQLAVVGALMAGLMLLLRWQSATAQATQLANVVADNARALAADLLEHEALDPDKASAAASLERLVESSDHHLAASLFQEGRSVARHARFGPQGVARELLTQFDATADNRYADAQGRPVAAPNGWQPLPAARVVQVESFDQRRQLRVLVSMALAQETQRSVMREGVFTVLGLAALVVLANALMVWAPRRQLAQAARMAERLPTGAPERLPEAPSGTAAVDVLRASLNHVGEVLAAQRSAQAQALAQAEAANQAKSRFLANMSHEMRTPLHGVIGTLDLALHQDDEQRRRQLLQTARSSANQLLHLVNEILDLSKIEAGRLELVPQPVDLHALLEGVLDMFGALADGKGLDLKLNGQAGTAEWPVVQVDGQRLRQVLINLLGNAVKFTAHGHVLLHVELGDAQDDVQPVRFTVQDSGPGIAPERVARLFEPFTQGDESTSRVYGGTGLGLAIARRLVHLMGGELGLSAAPGGGTLAHFALRLPRLPRCAALPAVDSSPVPPDVMALAGLRVLLAEDNDVNALVATSVLEGLGAQVVRAHDGHEALALAQRRGFDVVLMDLQMPLMDGQQAAHELRAWEAAQGLTPVPMIALTAHLFEDELRAQDGPLQHMNGYLGKPFTLPELLRAVQQVLTARTS